MLFDVRDEFCESFGKNNIFLNELMKNIGSHSNFDEPCPWYPGDKYIKDFNFGIEHVPSLVPEGRYLMNVSMNQGPKVVKVFWEIYFEIKNYGILDLRIG